MRRPASSVRHGAPGQDDVAHGCWAGWTGVRTAAWSEIAGETDPDMTEDRMAPFAAANVGIVLPVLSSHPET